MDSFQLQNNIIKVEKANKMLRHKKARLHQKLTALFRLIEVLVLLIIISRSSTNLLDINFKLSGEYIKALFVTLVSPGSVFIIGNVIVITLFLKSGQPTSQEPDPASRPNQHGCSMAYQEGSTSSKKHDLYDEYVESCQVVKYMETEAEQMIDHQEMSSLSFNNEKKIMKRSRSQNLKVMHSAEEEEEEEESLGHGLILRRSATERCLKSVDKRNNRRPCAVNEMSNEEFNYRVEAFIARQQRLLREEEEEEESESAEFTSFVAIEAY